MPAAFFRAVRHRPGLLRLLPAAAGAIAASADRVARTRVSFHTVIDCQPEMMFCTPWTVASWPDSGIGFQLLRLGAPSTTAFASPSFAAATPVDLVARANEHLLEDRAGLLVVPVRHELIGPLPRTSRSPKSRFKIES